MPAVIEWELQNRIPDAKMKNILIKCERKQANDFEYLECGIFDSDRLKIGEFAIRHYTFDAEWYRPIHYAGVESHELHFEWNDLDEDEG